MKNAAFAVLIALLTLAAPAPAHAELVSPRNVRVIDGDTMEDVRAGVVYRLANIDTPEVGRNARCAAERRLGERATRAARGLVSNAGRLELRPVGRIDSYGRSVAFIRIDGRDLGVQLIQDGLARPWRGRRQPWCDARGGLVR